MGLLDGIGLYRTGSDWIGYGWVDICINLHELVVWRSIVVYRYVSGESRFLPEPWRHDSLIA